MILFSSATGNHPYLPSPTTSPTSMPSVNTLAGRGSLQRPSRLQSASSISDSFGTWPLKQLRSPTTKKRDISLSLFHGHPFRRNSHGRRPSPSLVLSYTAPWPYPMADLDYLPYLDLPHPSHMHHPISVVGHPTEQSSPTFRGGQKCLVVHIVALLLFARQKFLKSKFG
ncbi:hypothetical protein FIBSPDRAFT_804851, partial [Athelia psychrophila]